MPNDSIVAPIYGVEKYIERCARSLFEQTLSMAPHSPSTTIKTSLCSSMSIVVIVVSIPY